MGAEINIIGQLFAMQSFINGLPTKECIIDFVCRGLEDIPGVISSCYQKRLSQADGKMMAGDDSSGLFQKCFVLDSSGSCHGFILLVIHSPEDYTPYEDYLNNFFHTLALVLEEKRLRQQIEEQNDFLENRVRQRTLELNRSHQEYRKINQEYSIVYNSTPVMMHTVDLNGVIVSVNDYWLQTMGYERQEVLGTPSSLYLSATSQNVFSGDIKILYAEGILENIEAQAVKKDGSKMDILASSRVDCDEEGGIRRIFTFFVDITERKKYEVELRKKNALLEKAKQKAEESDRLKSLFLANMSHEIRTPLNGILGFSHLLQNENLTREARSQYLGIVDSCGHNLLRIISDILDFSKIEAHQLEIHLTCVDVKKFLSEMFAQFELELKKIDQKRENIDLFLNIHRLRDGLTFVTGVTRLKQVLNNLLHNALKFTDFGTIELEVIEEKQEGQLKFLVRDTGLGIHQRDQRSIFESFIQGESNRKSVVGGAGPGLSICRGLIHLLGGHIGLKSQPGEGSTFFFTLPYSDERGFQP